MSGRHFCVLVMTDIVGSTARLADVGDARWATLLAEHRELLRTTASRRGGEYRGHTGDGLLLSFRSPGAALRCADELVDAAAALGTPVRVAVHAGEVEQLADGLGGLTVHVAAALVQCAAAGDVVVSPAVVPLVAGGELRFDDAGHHALKGVPQPWQLWWLRRPTAAEPGPAPSRLPLPHALEVTDLTFVGRVEELAVVHQAWQVAAAGRSASVVVTGEPGVGKTRLVAELCRRAHADGASVLFGHCDEGLRAPYQPVVEALEAFRRAASSNDAELGTEQVALARLVPRLRGVAPASPRRARGGGPEAERHRLFTATAEWLGSAAQRSPLVFVADDVHWAEEGTLALLRHVARAALPGLLLVMTARDTEPSPAAELGLLLADVARGPYARRIALKGLSREDVGSLVSGPGGVAETLTRETDGNPFFLREVLFDLAARGEAERTGDMWVTRHPLAVDVPSGVREAVQRRLDVLAPGCRPVLAAAAVVGLESDLRVVSAVAGVAEDDALTALEAAAAARLVDEVPAQERWRFTHALVRSALLTDLSSARTRRMHRDVVRAAAQSRHGMSAAQVAAHALAADQLLPTSEVGAHAEAAAMEAQLAAAPVEAFRWWQAAVQALAPAGQRDDAHLALLRVRAAEAAVRAGSPDWDALAEQALAASVAVDDVELASQAALVAPNSWWNGSITTRGITPRGARLLEALRVRGLGDVLDELPADEAPLDATTVRLLAALATELMWVPSSLQVRDTLSRQALERARELDDAAAVADATRCRSTAVWCGRTAHERAALAAEAEQLARAQGDAYGLRNSAALLAIAGIETADPDLLQRAQCAREDARQGPDPTMADYHLGLLDAGRRMLTDLPVVPELAASLKVMGEAVGHPDAAVFHFFQMQYVALLRGTPSEHLDLLVASLDATPGFAGTPALTVALLALAGRRADVGPLLASSIQLVTGCDNVLEGAAVAGLATAAALLDDQQAARVALAAMERVDAACLGSGLIYLGATAHWQGVCRAVVGDDAAAVELLNDGRRLHERLGLTVGLALSDAELARVHARSGSPEARIAADRARSAASSSGAGLALRRLEPVGL